MSHTFHDSRLKINKSGRQIRECRELTCKKGKAFFFMFDMLLMRYKSE